MPTRFQRYHKLISKYFDKSNSLACQDDEYHSHPMHV